LFIASKFEDIEQISSYDLAFVGDNSFTRDELIEMEQLILNALNFEMVTTNAHNFLFFFLRGFNLHEDKEIRETCESLLDLSIIPIKLRAFLPSLVALSILNMVAYTLYIKRKDTSIVFWNSEIEDRFGYKAEDLIKCQESLMELYYENINLGTLERATLNLKMMPQQ